MTKKKTTKRALVASLLVLVMCISMLVGSTFAWFTDSVTSSGNIIKSGKLDVSMMWADGKNDPATTAWTDAEAGAIFDNDLWEPGYTEVRHIKIANEGNLALKYKLTFTATGEYSKLAEVIDVYYVDPAQAIADRADLANATLIGTLADVLDNFETTAAGALKEGENHTVTLALKMQETAGNAYQELAIGSDFCVVLMATQDNVEVDSFDENYDDIDVPEKDIQVIDGNTYHYYNNGNVVLASVPYGNVGSTFTVRDDVTILGQGDVYDGAIPVFSKSSPIETITLNEGLVEIKARAMTGIKTLTSVNFPSTLEIIGVQAIAQSGMTELTIPATVKEVKYGAFTASPNLKTVTIEGNTLLDNYVFRDCGSLETIYLMGDDVKFVGGGMFATRKQSGDANGITIYVKNATVAARLIAAQNSAYGYEVKIMGEQGSENVDVVTVKTAAQLQTALDNATKDVTIVLNNDITGNVKLTQKAGIDVLVEGNNKKFTGVFTVFGGGSQTNTEKVTIQNVNFVAAAGADSCILSPDRTAQTPATYSYAHNVTVDNCTFTDPNGGFDCAAIRHADGGDVNWVVKNCKVDNTMHSLLQVNNVIGKLTISGCEVSSKNGANLNSCTNVEIADCDFDVTGYAVRLGVKTGGNLGEAKNYVIKDSTLKSANNDGDAVIIIRASAVDAVLTLENTTLVGTPDISGATADTTINK